MDQTEILTIEEIDIRMSENGARLEVIASELETKNAELGSTRVWKLPTVLINKAIDKLEHERRELVAEQKALEQERANIQSATARRDAEMAAAEYKELQEQQNALTLEIINGLGTLQSRSLDLEKVQAVMQEKATTAGALVDPMPSDVIVIHAGRIAGHIDRALLQITSLNGKENLEKAGIHIPDMYEERDRVFGAFSAAGFSDGVSKESALSTDPARRAAGLNDLQSETTSEPKGFVNAVRKAAGLPFE